MRHLPYFTALFTTLCSLQPALTQTDISMVKDINAIGSADLEQFIATDEKLYMLVSDGIHSRQFWVSDGEAQNSHWIPNELQSGQNIYQAWRFEEKVVMLIETYENTGLSYSLWITDGNAAGTFKLADVSAPGTATLPTAVYASGRLYLNIGNRFWRTDGSSGGTEDISGWVSSGDWGLENLVSDGATLYFSAHFPPDSAELWVSNGALNGTHRLQAFKGANDYFLRNFIVFKNNLYFTSSPVAATGVSFWKSDGTVGGTLLYKEESQLDGFCDNFVVAEDKFYFKFNANTANNPELWSSDGTAAGTQKLNVLPTGTEHIFGTTGIIFNGSMIFEATTATTHELWRTDGTSGSSYKICDLDLQFVSDAMEILDNKLYFFNISATGVKNLWSSDGTPGSKNLIKQMDSPDYNAAPIRFKNKLYFVASDDQHGEEPWCSDGTASGTTIFVDIRKSGDAAPYDFVAAGDKLFFSAIDFAHGRELWSTEGDESSTQLSRDIMPNGSSSILFPRALGDKIYFCAETPEQGRELWASDGTTPGTQLIKDINPGAASSRPYYLSPVFQDRLFFSALTPSTGAELWVSDGTTDGTKILKDIVPGPQSSNPRSFTPYHNKLYFIARGGQLWFTDGSAQGVQLVKVMSTLSNENSALNYSRLANDKMYFWVMQSNTGFEPWVSDGTNTGTFMLKDLTPGSSSSFPLGVYAYGGKTWIATNDNGVNLWISDGSSDGTQLFTTPDNPAGFEGVYNLMEYKGKLFFGTRGGKIWSTDGQPEHTTLVADLEADFRYGLYFLADFQGWLLFAAFETDKGIQLWRTNGEMNNAERIIPPFAVTNNSLAYTLEDAQVFKDAFYFTANYDENGAELYKLRIVNGLPVISSLAPSFQFSPNPAKGSSVFLNPQAIPGWINIYDAAGKSLHEVRIEAQTKQSINLQSMPPGVYFWVFSSIDGQSEAGKLLILN